MTEYRVTVDHPGRGIIRTVTHSRTFAWRMVNEYKRRFPGLVVIVARDGQPVWRYRPPQARLL